MKLRNLFLTIFCGTLLFVPSISSAVPDYYSYYNFLTGISPFSVPTSTDISSDGIWEDYSPIQSNLGFVTSFSTRDMVGNAGAVPVFDIDHFPSNSIVFNIASVSSVVRNPTVQPLIFFRPAPSRLPPRAFFSSFCSVSIFFCSFAS